jgi:hypothetical protein
MDKHTGLAILSNPEVVQHAMRGPSQTRALTLQIHEALVKARVPGYLEAYESCDENPFPEQADVKSKLAHLVDAGTRALRRNCAQ